jgi:short-subunit dehydrogenase
MTDAAAASFTSAPGAAPAATSSQAAARPAQAAVANKVVILGALSGMAMATARVYAAEGASLMLVARNQDRMDQVAADLRTRGASRVETAKVDLEADAGQAPELLAKWAAAMGGLDHVVVFHGYLGEQPKAWEDKAELARILSANFTSAALWAGAAGEMFRKAGKGSVVAVTSVAGDRGRQSNFAYGAAKAGLSVFMQGMAHGLAGTKARAVAIKAGPTDTAMTAGMTMSKAKPEDMAKAIRKAADKGGPIQYAPGKWKIIMLIIRTVPSFIFHKTKL